MAWIAPKTDWTAADGADDDDFNRIEGNITFIGANPTGTALQLAPAGGNVLIHKATDSGDDFQVDGTSLFGDDLTMSNSTLPRLTWNTVGAQYKIEVDTGTGAWTLADSTGTPVPRLQVFASGNVGIGTTVDPAVKLRVQGATETTGTSLFEDLLTLSDSTLPSIEWNTVGAKWRAEADTATGALSLADYTGTPVARLQLFASGNVGIGTTVDPSVKLRVEGTVEVAGVATFESQVVVTDSALPNVVWNTVGAQWRGEVDAGTGAWNLSDYTGTPVGRLRVDPAGVVSMPISLKVDTVNENAAAAGVTIDSVLLQDGGGTFSGPIIPTSAAVETLLSFSTGGVVVPRGLYQISGIGGSSSTHIEQQIASSWSDIIDGANDAGGFFASDGVNVRYRNSGGSGTKTVLKF